MEERNKWDRLVERMRYSILSGNGQRIFLRIQLLLLIVLFVVLSSHATEIVNCCGTCKRGYLSQRWDYIEVTGCLRTTLAVHFALTRAISVSCNDPVTLGEIPHLSELEHLLLEDVSVVKSLPCFD